MSDKVTVTVGEGKIRGIKKISSFSGIEYYSFLGVPYGQAPTGHLRFKDPVKVKPWKNEILHATTEKGGCRQFCVWKRDLTGSEDCLYNNIHTTELPTSGSNEPMKAVLAVLHPGGFLFGSPDPENNGSPEYSIHHNIVYVTIGFRLHILGFLDLGLKECSGNQALKDIILSLKWIKDNIRVFGGDPNNVTLLGSSSGASLVHCLMLSPKAKGLFHKAVLMGMYVMNPTLIVPRENLTIAFQLAKSTGYEGTIDDRKKLLAHFKQLPVDVIVGLRPDLIFFESNAPVYPSSLFMPIIGQGENSILPLSPKEMAPSTARIPLMVGFCDKEAVMAFHPKYQKVIKKYFYSTIRQNSLGWGYNLSNEELNQIKKQIEKFYLNGGSVHDAPLSTKCDIQTDISLSDVYDSLINVVAADLPTSVYVYKFEFEGSIATMKRMMEEQVNESFQGTVHACDFCYFAYGKEFTSRKKGILTPESHEVVEKFTKLICTFAKTGNPNHKSLNVHWEPTTVEKSKYLHITNQLTPVDGKLNGKRTEFWENLKKQFERN